MLLLTLKLIGLVIVILAFVLLIYSFIFLFLPFSSIYLFKTANNSNSIIIKLFCWSFGIVFLLLFTLIKLLTGGFDDADDYKIIKIKPPGPF